MTPFTFGRVSVRVLILTLGGLAGLGAHAQNVDFDADYLTPVRMRVEPVAENSLQTHVLERSLVLNDQPTGTDLDEAEVILDKIINMGSRIWTIVEKNHPVVTADPNSLASALPQGVRGWTDLAGWSTPSSRAYKVTFTNTYGIDVVDFTFRITYTYGGSFKGKGRFLTNVSIVPANLSVAWMYTFDANVQVKNITNASSTTGSPVAGMELQLNYTVKTAVKHTQVALQYYIRGDGAFVDLNR